MSDKLKAEKIAAAKKRLKEFQSKQKPHGLPIQNSLESPTPSQDRDNHLTSELDGNHSERSTASSTPSNIISLDHLISEQPNPMASFQITDPDPQSENPISKFFQTKPLEWSGNIQPTIETNQLDLTGQLNAEKFRNQQLNLSVVEQSHQIDELRHQIDQLKSAYVSKSQEIEPIQEQLRAHYTTVQLLIDEKNQLTGKLTEQQSMIDHQTEQLQLIELNWKESQKRVMEQQKIIDELSKNQQDAGNVQDQLKQLTEHYRNETDNLKKRLTDSTELIDELKEKFRQKSVEVDSVVKERSELESEVNQARLRIEQLTSGCDTTDSDRTLETLIREKETFQRQAEQQQTIIQQIQQERDQTNKQLQTYVTALTTDNEKLNETNQRYEQELIRLRNREAELIEHVQSVERSIQKQLAKQKSITDLQSESKRVEELNVKITELETEHEKLSKSLHERDEQIGLQTGEIDESKRIIEELNRRVDQLQTERPDSKALLATMESDKIAASRAVTQNQQLKQELEEIQRAFIQLSNDKLELTDKLQSEQHLGREYKGRYDVISGEIESLKETLHFKDEEMIRLSRENEQFHLEILQQTQELDRLRHYESHTGSLIELQQQLHVARERIKRLKDEIKELKGGEILATEPLESVSEELVQLDRTEEGIEVQECSTEPSDPLLQLDRNANHKINCDQVSLTSTINMETNEAMRKLQDRFKRTMTEIADLTDEKQRLEHLVLQLQGETETIGEYVALYQTQRRLLKQREIEKDQQLQRIAADREDMSSKLIQLNMLVERLLHQQNVSADRTVQIEPSVVNDANNVTSQTNGLASNVSVTEQIVPEQIPPKERTDTAKKIINLLSEIKDKNLTTDYASPSTAPINHCACCSGTLEIV